MKVKPKLKQTSEFPETALANLHDCVRQVAYSSVLEEIRRRPCPTCGRMSYRTAIVVRGYPPRAYLMFEHYRSGYTRYHRRVLPSGYAGMTGRLGAIADVTGVAAALTGGVTDSQQAWYIGQTNLARAHRAVKALACQTP
jgi:hypothetical protein